MKLTLRSEEQSRDSFDEQIVRSILQVLNRKVIDLTIREGTTVRDVTMDGGFGRVGSLGGGLR
jgi:ribosome-binding factor A